METFNNDQTDKTNYQIDNDVELKNACIAISNLLTSFINKQTKLNDVDRIRLAVSNIIEALRKTELKDSANVLSDILLNWDEEDDTKTQVLVLELSQINDQIVSIIPGLGFTSQLDYVKITHMILSGQLN